MTENVVLEVGRLGFPWATVDPFLFCVHHDDAYPEGNEQMGPNVSLRGRNLGQDFEIRDGFRMYHGHVVPGFPQHPHRGFETVTIARRGYIDHSDSLGATARFGGGDVQWMTAGSGIVHSEMFPLRERDQKNPVELFQIWLNLPHRDKLVPPHFAMLWNERIPRIEAFDAEGKKTVVTVVAGKLLEQVPPDPPPNSWAVHDESDVAIWTINLEPNASWTVPPAHTDANRTLYFFRGAQLQVAERTFTTHSAIRVRPDVSLVLKNGDQPTELLLLQGKPIGEPVVQYGPFVMCTEAEIQRAFADYRATQFGGWPWPKDDPVHPREQGRFAKHIDGHFEEP